MKFLKSLAKDGIGQSRMRIQVSGKRTDSEYTNVLESLLILYLLKFLNELANLLLN